MRKISWMHGAVLLCLLIAIVSSTLLQAKDDRSLPEEIIRFHVVANSDGAEDQWLKYAVRDKILLEVGPRLADAANIEESRVALLDLKEEIAEVATEVVTDWGKDYPVTVDYGYHFYPAKSYGDFILPAGRYEGLKVNLGKSRGANWWCILYPALCFIATEEATLVSVDGKEAVPLGIAETRKKVDELSEYTFFFKRFLDKPFFKPIESEEEEVISEDP